MSTTLYGSLYRGVACDGASAGAPRPEGGCAGPTAPGTRPDDPEAPPDWSANVPIAPTLAHVYTECARIWNPIHTDRAVARAAGLPDIILHGTATLALAVSEVLRHAPAASAAEVTRITCRFSAMVALPSTITVEGWMPDNGTRAIPFQVRNVEGRAALTRGCLVLAG